MVSRAVSTILAFAGWWCPEEAAGLLSRLFFCYVDGILRLGSRKALVQEDVWDLASRDQAQNVSAEFDDSRSSDPHRGSVKHTMWKQVGGAFVRAGIIKLVHDAAMFTGQSFSAAAAALRDALSVEISFLSICPYSLVNPIADLDED